jgi:hypothetical protein
MVSSPAMVVYLMAVAFLPIAFSSPAAFSFSSLPRGRCPDLLHTRITDPLLAFFYPVWLRPMARPWSHMHVISQQKSFFLFSCSIRRPFGRQLVIDNSTRSLQSWSLDAG